MNNSGIFLSHSHLDKRFVQQLAGDLALHGVRVWIDQAEMMIGDSLLQKISSAISEMEYVGVIISQHSVDSNWVKFELKLAMSLEIGGGKVKVLPLLVDDCKFPDFLNDKVYADFRTAESYKISLEMLLRRLCSSPRPNQTTGERTVKPVPILESKYTKPASALDIQPVDLYSLPANSLLGLLFRCCHRCEDPLTANWHDGNYMHDVFWNPLIYQIKPLFRDMLIYPPGTDRQSGLQRALKTLNEALEVVMKKPHRVLSPEIVIEILGIWIALVEFTIGNTAQAQKVFYGTYCLYGVINSENSICCNAMRNDFKRLSNAVKQERWTDTSSFSPEDFWGYLWESDRPDFFNPNLQQKVSFLTSFFNY